MRGDAKFLTGEQSRIVQRAIETDPVVFADYKRVNIQATRFEELLTSYLLGSSAICISSASATPGHPDVLFEEPVLIQGREVRWLDAKNYLLTSFEPIAAKLWEQARRYQRRFGPGAHVFSLGFTQGAYDVANSAGISILNGSHAVLSQHLNQDGYISPEELSQMNFGRT